MNLPKLTARNSLKLPGKSYKSEVVGREKDLMELNHTLLPNSENNAYRQGSIKPASMGRSNFIYAYGSIRANFPSLSVEKEFYQSLGDEPGESSETSAPDQLEELTYMNLHLTSQSILYSVLNKPENSYISREMCWVFQNVQGVDCCIVDWHSDEQLQELINALASTDDQPLSRLKLIGRKQDDSDAANPMCKIYQIPAVSLTSISPLSETFLSGIKKLTSSRGKTKVEPILSESMFFLENSSCSDQDRAINYILLNSCDYYNNTFDLLHNGKAPNVDGFQLQNIRTMHLSGESPNSRIRVIFDFEGLNTLSRKSFFVTVDVSDEFPYLTTEWERFYG